VVVKAEAVKDAVDVIALIVVEDLAVVITLEDVKGVEEVVSEDVLAEAVEDTIVEVVKDADEASDVVTAAVDDAMVEDVAGVEPVVTAAEVKAEVVRDMLQDPVGS